MRFYQAIPVILLIAAVVGIGCRSKAAEQQDLEAVAPAVSCTSLANADIGKEVGAPVKVTNAVEGTVDGGRYCKLEGTVAEHVRFELRLPTAGWTQRYVQLGCGGLCGVLSVRLEHAEDCRPAQDHALALASTDMGHQGKFMGDGTFGNDPQARIDFAYRGVHLTALASKALIHRFYRKKARFAYFSGCSDGGREGLMEAQRFPDDFDGIVAGAPAMNFQVQNTFYHAWMYRSNHRADGSAILLAAKLPALHAAALKSCDAMDGVKDGIITDPRLCVFDPADAACKSGQKPDERCLTEEEIDVARKFYEGPRDAAGHRFTIGGPQVGSELAWEGVYVPGSANEPVMSQGAALGSLQYLTFATNPPPGYTLNEFRFEQETFDRLKALHALYDATDTDLSRFEAHHGKLLLWHGWSDPHISPVNTIAYFHAVREGLGATRADNLVRLFLFPGMYHCGGGDGFSAFDVLTPLMAWTEQGSAPEVITAAHAPEGHPMGKPMGARPAGAPPLPPPEQGIGASEMSTLPSNHGLPGPVRTRPVYAYPKVARYAGTGSIDAAASFTASAPLVADPEAYEWQGAGFMAPGFHQDCSAKDGRLTCP